MCEYCEKGKLIPSLNFCGRGKLRITDDGEMDAYEEPYQKEIKMFRSTYAPTWLIHYCPMCGKELKNES